MSEPKAKQYVIPVSYAQTDEQTLLCSTLRRRGWWKNLKIEPIFWQLRRYSLRQNLFELGNLTAVHTG